MAQRNESRWLVVEELLERGDPAFVDEIRRIVDAEALGDFAGRWYADTRTASRRLLLAYLDRPLNAFRHEALIKRLFKLAEAAGDDQVMGRFAVALDRSVRRKLVNARKVEWRQVDGEEAAKALERVWKGLPHTEVSYYGRGRRYNVWRHWTQQEIRTPRDTVMPRGKQQDFYDQRGIKQSVADWIVRLQLTQGRYKDPDQIPDAVRAKLERYRLFSTPTRNYLRRRCWRYFRKLGKEHPGRYVPAVAEMLNRYQDHDAADSLALLDNWSLMHILFHESPAIEARVTGWRTAEGRSLSELEPSPIYPNLWAEAPRALFELLGRAKARPVRRWALGMIMRNQGAVLRVVSLEDWLSLIVHEDDEIASLAADSLRDNPGLAGIDATFWLELAERANPSALELLVELMRAHVRPEALSFEQVVALAMSRPLPLARLGFDWLRAHKVRTEAEGLSLLALVETEAESLRAGIVAWVRTALTESLGFRLPWLLEYFDSRHRDVRDEAWNWFRDVLEARNDVELWRRLLESPYDDVQLGLIAELEAHVDGRDIEGLEPLALEPESIRLLWASVLLNIHRGNRAKPVVIRQLLRRLAKHPDELPQLLPLLAIALRSTRGPEWRAGLAAIVQAAGRDSESETLVRRAFPELHWA